MTAVDSARHFGEALGRFVAAGLPVLTGKPYSDRVLICKACLRYRHFQCQQCRCLVVVKAALATEVCPLGYWPP